VLYAPLLLLIEIGQAEIGEANKSASPFGERARRFVFGEAKKPASPFGEQVRRFVCGQPSCNHRICNENIRLVREESSRAGVASDMV
jgi:hypothetical protein